MIRSRLAAIAVAAILAACGGKSSTPPTAPEPPPTATEASAADGAGESGTADPAAPADGTAAAPAGPKPTDAEIAAAVDKSLVFIEELAKTAAANKGKCGAIADGFQALLDKNGDLMSQIRAYGADQEIGAKAQAEMQKNLPRWEAATKTLQESVAGCESDPKLQKVFEQLMG
jgi:hypothetical protein